MTTKQRRFDGDIEDEIIRLALETSWSAPQIFRDLDSREEFEDRVPSKRTVERAVSDIRTADKSDPWKITDNDPEDARLLLDLLGTVSFRRYYRERQITKNEANWVITIIKLAPDLTAMRTYVLSNLYRIRTDKEASTEELDAYLAISPWQSDEALRTYKFMVEDDLVEPMTMWESMVEQVEWKGIPEEGGRNER